MYTEHAFLTLPVYRKEKEKFQDFTSGYSARRSEEKQVPPSPLQDGPPGTRAGNRDPSPHSVLASLHSLGSVNTPLLSQASQQGACPPLPPTSLRWSRSIFISCDAQLMSQPAAMLLVPGFAQCGGQPKAITVHFRLHMARMACRPAWRSPDAGIKSLDHVRLLNISQLEQIRRKKKQPPQLPPPSR